MSDCAKNRACASGTLVAAHQSMGLRVIWVALAVGVVAGCVGAPREASGLAARAGTPVEVMLVPFDEGATLAEGAEAFDAQVATTDSLTALADGRGAFVIGVADGQGIALVPIALTDEVAAAEEEQADLPQEWGEPPEPPPSCAADCATWCTTSLAHCDGDGFAICDCASDEPDPDPDPEEAPAACTWDCAEWCTSALDYCEGDGWAACADSCAWPEARPVPASGFAGADGSAPTVVDGVALAVRMSDARAREALGRGQPIGPQVGGTYGRQADEVLVRLLEVVARSGLATDDPALSCGQRLLNRGYRPTMSASTRDAVRVGICQQNGLEVWPQSIGLTTFGLSNVRFAFEHLTPGTGTPASDVLIRWGQAGALTTVAPGTNANVDMRIDPIVGLPLDVVVQRTGSTAGVRVAVQN